ncbi:hypothetical protein GCK72_019166 [Caenorhabditis remanei]|uniref:Serpentine receptor class r-10 n=1 Tax=Caenorhabditis remanei TaxID=31234 RepID=A0A6A5GD10_CAERE|nr:hypothetical protein GCK72_019166 [Caenorhabditis remanei]KAF1752611.1 hypothetical protein GCK72_019166 [Caenorhabditis remanei]
MSDRHWLEITTYSDHVGFTISTIANFTLLFLLAVRPTKALGSYRYLMLSFCVFSLFYTSIETFLRPLIHIYDNTIFVIQRKRFDYSETTARAISSTYCGCYAMSFTLFAVHFVYRYYAACKPDNLRYFQGFYFVSWVLGAMLVAGSWGFAAFILYPETERTKTALLHVIKTSYDLDPYWIGNVPYSYWRTENGVEYLNPRNVIGILQHGVIMTVSFGTVFYCGYQTHKTIQATSFLSQTIIPTFLMYLPTTMLFVTPFVGLNIGCYGNITTATVHLYPGIDPLVLIFLIKDFRRTLMKSLCFWSAAKRRIDTSTTLKSYQLSVSKA